MSFLTDLQHSHTPPELAQINTRLNAVLLTQPLNETQLQNIIGERANLVDSLLINLDEQQKRRFAEQEIHTNNALSALVENYRDNVRAELAKVSKSSKAIKKYHQV